MELVIEALSPRAGGQEAPTFVGSSHVHSCPSTQNLETVKS